MIFFVVLLSFFLIGCRPASNGEESDNVSNQHITPISKETETETTEEFENNNLENNLEINTEINLSEISSEELFDLFLDGKVSPINTSFGDPYNLIAEGFYEEKVLTPHIEDEKIRLKYVYITRELNFELLPSAKAYFKFSTYKIWRPVFLAATFVSDSSSIDVTTTNLYHWQHALGDIDGTAGFAGTVDMEKAGVLGRWYSSKEEFEEVEKGSPNYIKQCDFNFVYKKWDFPVTLNKYESGDKIYLHISVHQKATEQFINDMSENKVKPKKYREYQTYYTISQVHPVYRSYTNFSSLPERKKLVLSRLKAVPELFNVTFEFDKNWK
nr:hypothetical protein [uncultured Treponema sp.]